MNKFAEGMLNGLLGKAKRDDVSAFNLENLLFGTLGHIGLGVIVMSIILTSSSLQSPHWVTGTVKPVLTGFSSKGGI